MEFGNFTQKSNFSHKLKFCPKIEILFKNPILIKNWNLKTGQISKKLPNLHKNSTFFMFFNNLVKISNFFVAFYFFEFFDHNSWILEILLKNPLLVINWNFVQKSKFCSKIKLLLKNRNFVQKSKFVKKSKVFAQKSNFCSNIEF